MKRYNLIAVLALLLMTSSQLVAQTDYFVSASGDDTNNGLSVAAAFKTVGQAVLTASSGDVIHIVAGSAIQEPAQISLGAKSLTIQGYGGKARITRTGGSSYFLATSGGGTANLTLKDIIVDATGSATSNFTVHIYNMNSVTIDNVDCIGLGKSHLTGGLPYDWSKCVGGIDVNTATNVLVTNVFVQDHSRNGLAFLDIGALTITNFVVEDCGYPGSGGAGLALYGTITSTSLSGTNSIDNVPIGVNTVPGAGLPTSGSIDITNADTHVIVTSNAAGQSFAQNIVTPASKFMVYPPGGPVAFYYTTQAAAEGAASNLAANPAFMGSSWLIYDLANSAMFAHVVGPVASPTATVNDFTVLESAIANATNGMTIDIQGTFDWTETNALASYTASYANSNSSDIRGIELPDGVDNLTLTSSTSNGKIVGAGDITESPTALIASSCFFADDGGSASGNDFLTIEGLEFEDFEIAICLGWNATGTFNNTLVKSNTVLLAGDDGDATDWLQNIAFYFWKGTDQILEDNTVTFLCNGSRTVGYFGPKNPSSFGYQCGTSGGTGYDGLQIKNNVFQVSPASGGVEETVGIWENSHNDNNSSVIEITGNQFLGRSGDLFDNALQLSSQTSGMVIHGNIFTDVDDIYKTSTSSTAGDEYTITGSVCTRIGGTDGVFLQNVRNTATPFTVTVHWGADNTIDGFTGARMVNELSAQATGATRTNTAATDISYVDIVGGAAEVFVDPSWTTANRFEDPDGIGTGSGPMAYGYNAVSTIQAGIAAAADDGTVNVSAATYVETGQIVIDKNLSVVGEDAATTIVKTAQNTGSSGDARGWFLIETNKRLDLSKVTLDGSGYNVYQALRFKTGPDCIVDDVVIKNITHPGYSGLGAALIDRSVKFSNAVFSNIGRVGVLFYGSGTSNGVAESCVYTGKGTGDHLDYAFEFGGGAKGSVTGCTISNNLGVASSDGSTSAGILATTYYGSGTEATILDNNINGCTTGIAVGYDNTDATTITANNNDLSGNSTGISATASSSSINAEYNWWGSNDGPEDLVGTTEVPTVTPPSVANMKNAAPSATLGVPVGEHIDYYPWSTQNNITQSGLDYDFDGNGDGTDDVTMNFSILPAGGGNVTVNWYGYVPSHAAALPQGGLNNIFLEITSDLPNYQFEVTITLAALPSGFGSNTKVHFYNTSSHKWMLIGGTYDDNGTPAVASDDTFTFTVNHFTQFSFVNTPSTPLVLKIDDGIVSDSFDESTISPAATWQGWMGTGDLTGDWSWEHQVFSIAVRPEYSGTGTADVFASSITLQYDPSDWALNTGVGTVGTGVGSIFGTYSLQHLAQQGTAGTDNTITADISITDIGNPQGAVDNVKTLTTFAFTALGGFPSPIVFNDAHVRTNLNEAYILDLNDDGRSRIYLGDVVDTTGSWLTLPSITVDHSSGDGAVDVNDLNAWAISYFSDVAPSGPLGNYKLKYDLGPTTTNYIDGLPQPDGLINFEDLVIFAISYGLYANNSYPKLPVQEQAVAVDLGEPVASGKQTLLPVMLRGPVTDVRALSLQFTLPQGASLVGVNKGRLLEEDGFLAHETDDNVVTVDMARMGASMCEEGVLCMLALENGTDAALVRALARDGYNRPVEVNGATPSMPHSVTLAQNYPNPFNPNTMIRFTLGESMPVRLEVYTTLGERVATLLDANRDAGTHGVQWNGRGDDGREVASGMYIYRLTAGATVLQKTMVLNK